jgi:arginase family enzyme
MSTTYAIDFGFEGRGASFEDAHVVLLFASNAAKKALETTSGPTAIADASRFIELFEMQVGVSPMDVGVYSEIVGGEDPIASTVTRSREVEAARKVPILVGGNRRVTEDRSKSPLVAMWGKLGRPEANESSLFEARHTVLVGVRAATSSAFTAMSGDIAIVTPKAFLKSRDALSDIVEKIKTPVHLSIDLDVLAPGVVQNDRSLEPGGLSWYDLMDALQIVFEGPGVSLVDLTGTEAIRPRTPAACIGAQLILNVAGLIRAQRGR